MKNDEEIMKIYYEEIGKEHLLTPDAEASLSARVLQGDMQAADRLVRANLRFVIVLAKEYVGHGLELNDLVAEGNVGLVQASRRYDARTGRRFTAYVAPLIRKSMEKAIAQQRNAMNVPKNERTPATLRRTTTVSVDAQRAGGNRLSLLQVLRNEDAADTDAAAMQQLLTEELKAGLHVLDERERRVIVNYYGIDTERCTMAEIGKEMGLKRERVRQIRKRALRRMHREGSLRAVLREHI